VLPNTLEDGMCSPIKDPELEDGHIPHSEAVLRNHAFSKI